MLKNNLNGLVLQLEVNQQLKILVSLDLVDIQQKIHQDWDRLTDPSQEALYKQIVFFVEKDLRIAIAHKENEVTRKLADSTEKVNDQRFYFMVLLLALIGIALSNGLLNRERNDAANASDSIHGLSWFTIIGSFVLALIYQRIPHSGANQELSRDIQNEKSDSENTLMKQWQQFSEKVLGELKSALPVYQQVAVNPGQQPVTDNSVQHQPPVLNI